MRSTSDLIFSGVAYISLIYCIPFALGDGNKDDKHFSVGDDIKEMCGMTMKTVFNSNFPTFDAAMMRVRKVLIGAVNGYAVCWIFYCLVCKRSSFMQLLVCSWRFSSLVFLNILVS